MRPFTFQDPYFLRMLQPSNVGAGFIIKVNSGADSQFTIPTSGGGYNYDLKTSDGQSFTGLTGNQTIIFPATNTDYILEVSGDFPYWYYFTSESAKIIDIMQWGDIKWSLFEYSFFGCNNLTSSAIDKPDLSNVTNMNGMFWNSSFNVDISGWDVSNVTNMSNMFNGSQFNKDISGWDVSSVTTMSWMFRGSSFNQNISGWNVNTVTQWYDFRTGSPLTDPNTPPKFL